MPRRKPLPPLTPAEAQDVLEILRRPYVYKAGPSDYRVKVRDAQGDWHEHGGVFSTRLAAVEHIEKLKL